MYTGKLPKHKHWIEATSRPTCCVFSASRCTAINVICGLNILFH